MTCIESSITPFEADVLPPGDLATIASRINSAHAAFERSGQMALSLAAEAGALLLDARRIVPHGGWLPWLKDNFRGSQPTAHRYMLVAANRETVEANYSRANNLSLRSVVKLLTKERHGSGQLVLTGEPESDAQASPVAVTTARAVVTLEELVESGEKFGTIYADPPWLYDNQRTRAATSNHYSGMTVPEIAALPVRELAADDAHLHLWVTNGFLFQSKAILDAWGFEFRSTFVWCKPQMGIGNYWRNSHEILLTAIRGNAKRFNDRSLKSWEAFDRGAHSAKPERVREYIERASPGPRLELFGRRLADGWTVWGNQIDRTMFDPEAA